MPRLARLLIVMLVGLAPFAPAVLSVSTAQARDVECDEAGSCITYCTQNLPDGSRVRYDEGTTITVITTDGVQHKFKCQNGQWVSAAIIQIPQWSKIRTLGNIGVGAIAGVKGDSATDACTIILLSSVGSDCFQTQIGLPGLAGVATE